MSTTSLKLPDELKSQAVAMAAEKGVSTHAFLVDSVRKNIDTERRQRQFIAAADQAWQEMQESGEGFSADDVDAYVEQIARGEQPEAPTPVKWRK